MHPQREYLPYIWEPPPPKKRVTKERKKRQKPTYVSTPDLVDFRPFKKKIIPILPPTSHLREPLEDEKDFVVKAEITIRLFVYLKLLKLEEEERAKPESQ